MSDLHSNEPGRVGDPRLDARSTMLESREEAIEHFAGEYAFLSCGYPLPLKVEGRWYPSAAHAYLALSVPDPSLRQNIAALARPEDAAAFTRAYPARADWALQHEGALLFVLTAKFEAPALAEALRATGSRLLGDVREGEGWLWQGASGVSTNLPCEWLTRLRQRLAGAPEGAWAHRH